MAPHLSGRYPEQASSLGCMPGVGSRPEVASCPSRPSNCWIPSIPSARFCFSERDHRYRLRARPRRQSSSILRFNLSETASLAEQKASRAEVVLALRELFHNLKPTSGLLNLPLYEWRSLFTTNYDTLIEQCYIRRDLPLGVYTSNFDFGTNHSPATQKLFKLHGTIDQDISSGHRARLILSEADYDQTLDYREFLYDRLKGDLAGGRLIIIGYSLADPDIREAVTRALALNARAETGGQIVLLLYTKDLDRASLYEKRGLQVCFAGVDEFFAGLTERHFGGAPKIDANNPLDQNPALRPVTLDVEHASDAKRADASAMFNGWPATDAELQPCSVTAATALRQRGGQPHLRGVDTVIF